MLIALGLMFFASFVAARFGLVTLIAKGYGTSAYLFLLLYVVPLFTIGTWWVFRSKHLSNKQSGLG
jgi:uncharacterized membrane protein YkvI